MFFHLCQSKSRVGQQISITCPLGLSNYKPRSAAAQSFAGCLLTIERLVTSEDDFSLFHILYHASCIMHLASCFPRKVCTGGVYILTRNNVQFKSRSDINKYSIKLFIRCCGIEVTWPQIYNCLKNVFYLVNCNAIFTLGITIKLFISFVTLCWITTILLCHLKSTSVANRALKS